MSKKLIIFQRGFGLLSCLLCVSLAAGIAMSLWGLAVDLKHHAERQNAQLSATSQALWLVQSLKHEIRLAGRADCEREFSLSPAWEIMPAGNVLPNLSPKFSSSSALIINRCGWYKKNFVPLKIAFYLDRNLASSSGGSLYKKILLVDGKRVNATRDVWLDNLQDFSVSSCCLSSRNQDPWRCGFKSGNVSADHACVLRVTFDLLLRSELVNPLSKQEVPVQKWIIAEQPYA